MVFFPFSSAEMAYPECFPGAISFVYIDAALTIEAYKGIVI